jgi:PTS system mannose-specific IIA component
VIRVLLLTRGDLAEAWLRATEATCGCPLEGFETLALAWDQSCDDDIAHVRNKLLAMRRQGPVLVLTDLLGGTPANLACEHSEDDGVAVVGGANLPMVLRLACEDRGRRSLDELADWICDKGRAAIGRIGGRTSRPGR